MELSAADWFDLDYCAPRGIPLSVFRGRVVALGESQWSEDDWDAARQWQARENRRCQDCGQDLNETMGPDNFDKWNAEVVGHCDACRAGHRTSMIAADRDDLDPNVGARLRFWRDP